MGRSGLKLWLELHNINTFSGTRSSRPKSMTSSRSFNPNFTKNKDILWDKLMTNFEKVYKSLLNENMKCKHIYLRLRTKSFEYHSAKKVLPDFTHDKEILRNTIKELFDSVYHPNIFYRTTGLGFGEFNYQHYQNRALFDDSDMSTTNWHVLYSVMSNLNHKY